MRTLESMINKLSPLGIYNFDENTMVYAETAAFAVGIDMLREFSDKLLKEMFAETAEDFGLEVFEKAVGKKSDDLPLEKRRDMIKERLKLSAGDFTLSGFEKMLRCLGAEGEICEQPLAERMYLDLTGADINNAQRSFLVAQAEELLPAHLLCDVVFEGFDWEKFESKNLTFSEMDGKGLNWYEIDYIL